MFSTFVRSASALRITRRSLSGTSGVVQVGIDEARSKTAEALRKLGWDEEDAQIQAEVMTLAELSGNNQGLVKMYQPALMAPYEDTSKPTVERETATSAVVNAHHSPGMLACTKAAELAVAKASPISIVPIYNVATSSGQLAIYVKRMAEQGVVGIAMCNSPEYVAAAKGGKKVLGTNPIAFGIPQKGKEPFTFDMATSSMALYGLLTAKAKGEPLPPNVAYGRDGDWTTDAAEALESGAIATFGGHKGAGLSLCVELLAGALSGSAVLGQCESKAAAKNWGHVFIGIKPDALVDGFEEKSASIIDAVRASGPGIRIPGERSTAMTRERMEAGTMPIPTEVWNKICETAEHGLK